MLAAMTWPQWGLTVVIVFVCLFLMLVILLQRGRGGGLAGAFGGGGSSAFGAKTGDVFTWITVVVAGVFVVLAVISNYAFDESQFPVIETPVVAAPSEAPKVFPIQLGEDGEALPLDLESIQLSPPPATPSEPAAQPAPESPPDAPPRGSEEPAEPPPAEPKPEEESGAP
jgi:preprotein translocase subunit SecG